MDISDSDDIQEFFRVHDLTKPHIIRDQIQTILGGMKPRKLENYQRALVHKTVKKYTYYALNQKYPVCSYLLDHGKPASNERLEYLGDSILNTIVGCYLFEKYPTKDEGFLTRLRIKMVRDTHCVMFSELIGIGQHILAGNFVKKNAEGRYPEKLLEDCFEAFVGAIYLDLGFKFVQDYVVKLINKHVDFEALLQDDNYKDILMRYTQSKGIPLPEYDCKVLSQPSGQPGQLTKTYKVQVILTIDGLKHKMGIGEARTKTAAEQESAKNTLDQVDVRDLMHLPGMIQGKKNVPKWSLERENKKSG